MGLLKTILHVIAYIIALHLFAIGFFTFVEMRLPDFNIQNWMGYERALLLACWLMLFGGGISYTTHKHKKN